jgi:uncharacterized protein YndB with AHSA1/START domain
MKNQLNVAKSGELEIVITRDFDAPRHLVWDAISKPDLLKRWLFGPPGWEMTACDDDHRVGGAFRWAWRGPDGQEMAMRGINREIVPFERVVRTESFEFGCPAQGCEQVATLVLKDDGQRTKLNLTVRYPSKEARDGALASGMDRGMVAGYDRLDEILASSAAVQ